MWCCMMHELGVFEVLLRLAEAKVVLWCIALLAFHVPPPLAWRSLDFRFSGKVVQKLLSRILFLKKSMVFMFFSFELTGSCRYLHGAEREIEKERERAPNRFPARLK